MKGYIARDNASVEDCKIGVENHLKGNLNYEKNGFYFSDRPEGAIRLSPNLDSNNIYQVEASGKIICGDDYFENLEQDIQGIYACDTILIKEPVFRNDIVTMVFLSNNISRAKFLLMYIKLTPVEIDAFIKKYGERLVPYVEYYQYGNKDAFYEYYANYIKETKLILEQKRG